LERLRVGDVMTRDVVTVPAGLPVPALMRDYFLDGGPRQHPAYPVVGKAGDLVGLVTRSNLLGHWFSGLFDGNGGADSIKAAPIITYDLIDRAPVVISPAATC